MGLNQLNTNKKIIDIVATGSKCDQNILEKAVVYLEKRGFTPRHVDVFFDDHPLYAAQDSVRMESLKQALYAEDSDFIWCLRGGCGTSRLIPHLLNLKEPNRKKTVIGFSDVTALHLFLTQNWGWSAIHGASLNFLVRNQSEPEIEAMMLDIVKDREVKIDLPIRALNDTAKSTNFIEGNVTGGNLSLLQMSIGTKWQMDGTNKIIVIEDINLPPYRVAEILDHLLNAGVFNNAKAIIFGDFTCEDEKLNNDDLLEFLLNEFASGISTPVYAGLAIGHIANNHPIVLNKTAEISNMHFRQSISI